MGKRRNSLIILGLVVVLLGDLDLRDRQEADGARPRSASGGTELVYQGRPTPQVPDVTPEDIDRAIEIIRERVDSLGVSEPEISRVGGDQIEIGLPNVSNADRAAESVGTTAQLYLYDFEPNVIPPNKSVQDPADRPYNRLYDAVLAASKQAPVSDEQCEKQGCTASGDTYYLFDANTLEPIGDPSEARSDLFASSPNEKQPPDTKLLAVPQGTVVLEDKPEDDPTTDVDESATGSQFFVLHDKPSLTGDQITDPKPGTDQFNQPTVDFNFTDWGARRSRASPRRSPSAAPTTTSPPPSTAVRRHRLQPGRPVLGLVRDRPRRRADLAPDHQLHRQPERDRRPHRRADLRRHRPGGQRPRRGAEDRRPADQARADQPVDRLGDARPAGARPGPEGGPDRARPRGPLPALLLPLPRPDRGARAARLRALLLRPDQGAADHRDAAGDRGIDPHDRRRGRLEHRHLRADQGGGARGQIDALGDLRGLPQGDRDDRRRERDHAADRVHPLRPRDRRRQGLRVHARHRNDRLAVHGGAVHAGDPRPARALEHPALAVVPRRQRRGAAVEVRLHRRLEVLLLDLRGDPRDRRDRVRDQAAQPRDRLRVRHQDRGRAGQAGDASTRSARRSRTAASTAPTRRRSRRPRTPTSAAT